MVATTSRSTGMNLIERIKADRILIIFAVYDQENVYLL